jgi:hypothetical protein
METLTPTPTSTMTSLTPTTGTPTTTNTSTMTTATPTTATPTTATPGSTTTTHFNRNITPVPNTGGIFDGLLFVLNSLNLSGGTTPPVNTANLSDSLASINSSATEVLNNQGTLNSIVDEETNVLNARLQNMNDSVNAAQRNLMLNESARLKTQDYNTILYYFIGLIVFLNALTILNRWYSIFSKEMFDLIIIFTVFYVFYVVYWKYADILNRDVLNYNEISLPKPGNVAMSQQQIISQNNLNNQMLAGQGRIFNLPNNNGQCAEPNSPKLSTPVPTISGFTLMNEIKPNSFNEFEHYSRI